MGGAIFCEFEGAKGMRMAANSEVGGDISKRSSGDMGRDSWSSTRSLRPRAGIWMGSDVERLNWASSVVEIIVMLKERLSSWAMLWRKRCIHASAKCRF